MYAMYPDTYTGAETRGYGAEDQSRPREWGPAKHDPSDPRSRAAVQAALDLRDSGSERPDDN